MIYPWSGLGQKLSNYDIPRIGSLIGVGEDEIHAILDVETNGSGFDNNGVTRLFEEHIFYRQLSLEKKSTAVSLGLAYPEWRSNYKNNYEKLINAYNYDRHAALNSCSWGLGQIMGFNCKLAGYQTVYDMLSAFVVSEANQLEAMIKFIINAKLDDNLRNHDWEGFAEGYNGSGYKRNNYHNRLAKRYYFWKAKPDTVWSPEMAKEESEQNSVLIANAVKEQLEKINTDPFKNPFLV